ncbi:MAG: hypothetical protein ABIK79_02570 [Chloroflexota bacterium]
MEALTSKHRLLRLVRDQYQGEPIDRVPASPFIFRNIVWELHSTRDIDLIEGTIEVFRHFGFGILDHNCTLAVPFEDFLVTNATVLPYATLLDSGRRNLRHHRMISQPRRAWSFAAGDRT